MSKLEKFVGRKVFKRRLWEGLTVGLATVLTLGIGGLNIANANSTAINAALGIATSEIKRSDDEQYQYFKSDYASNEYSKLQADFLAVGEEAEGEGLVLLKNDNDALPLSNGDKVSTFLSGSYLFNYSTSGSSAADTSGYTDFKTALENGGLKVNDKLWNFYKEQTGDKRVTVDGEKYRGYKRQKNGTTYIINEAPYSLMGDDVTATFSEYGTAIVNIARDSGEGADLNAASQDKFKSVVGTDGSCLSLTQTERDILKQLTTLKANDVVKKVIVLLNTSATVQLDFLYEDGIEVDACMWIGNVGKSGIGAVVKALTGEIVPSGKLSDTYLKDNFSSPAMAQQSFNPGKRFMQSYDDKSGKLTDESQRSYGVYSEGIYVGYRYYETRYADYVLGTGNAGEYSYSDDVAYPFGYGMSYADFEYSDLQVKESDDGKHLEVSVTITNKSAEFSGKEAVGVYLQKPYTSYDRDNGVEKAAVELVGYTKTDKIGNAGSGNNSQTVTVKVEKERFKSYDANNAGTYILENGDYFLTVANGSHEAVNNILAAQGKTPVNTENKMDAAGDASLVYKETVTVDGENGVDKTTYSKSSHVDGDVQITNRLDKSDLNKYEGSNTHVTYVSRNDWTGTWPKAGITVELTSQMAADLKNNKSTPKDDGKGVSYGKSNGLTIAKLRGKNYDDADWDKLLDQMTFEEQANLITAGLYQTATVSSVAKPDTSDNDGPNGVVGSKGKLSLPSEGIWASSFNDELIERIGKMLAEDARAAGLTGIYANAVNIHRMPFGGRSHEYFSEDPYLSGMAGAAEVKGIQSKGVIAHVKHIAFNDQEDVRKGGAVWLNEQEAREIMLLPFEYTLSEDGGNAHAVMSAMNRSGTDWVGANPELLNNIMRGEWGFDGYCITDMMIGNVFIMTYKDGLPNGTDVFMNSGSKDALDDYKGDKYFCRDMREASHRILYAVANYSCAMNGITPDTSVNEAGWWWQILLITVDSVFGALTLGAAVMYALSLIKEFYKRKEARAAVGAADGEDHADNGENAEADGENSQTE